MRIHWIQHVSFEKLGNIEEWVRHNNHSLTCTRQYEGDRLPHTKDFDILIVMGGPMGVTDTGTYAWLKKELLFIKSSIELGKAVLGICLGSQLIAAAMGAKVYPGSMKEIGWFPINIYPNKKPLLFTFKDDIQMVFHWHGDTFDLPDNAELLASTSQVPNQAFIIHNKVIGLQFHLEQTEDTIKEMVINCGGELTEKGTKIQTAQQIEHEKSYFDSNKKVMFHILDYLYSKVM